MTIAKQKHQHGKIVGARIAHLRPLLVIDSDIFAGTERHILDLATALAIQGVRVSLACPNNCVLEKRARAVGIRVFSVPRKVFPVAIIMLIVHKILSSEVNIIHAHNGVSHIAAVIAISIAGKGKCVATQHFITPARQMRSGWKSWLSKRLHSWASARTAHLIAISNAVVEACRRDQPRLDQPIDVIHNGIFPIGELARPAADVRDQFSLLPEAPLVVAVARLDAEKRLDILIDAMLHVRMKFPQARCLIAGEGHSRKALVSLVNRLELADAVTLVGYQNDCASLIAACDVFVLPAECEPFGLVVLEAMMLGKPVIVANSGGPKEIIEHDRSGCLFKPNDSISLAQQIVRLLGDRSLSSELGRMAKMTCSNQFTADRMAASTLEIYRTALRAPRVGSD